MTEMNKGDLETLESVQIVLRQLMVALAAGSGADIGAVGGYLRLFVERSGNNIPPTALDMLNDLATGAEQLAAGRVGKH